MAEPGIVGPAVWEMSDDEVFDAADNFMRAVDDMCAKLKETAEETVAEMTRALQPAVEWARKVEARAAANT